MFLTSLFKQRSAALLGLCFWRLLLESLDGVSEAQVFLQAQAACEAKAADFILSSIQEVAPCLPQVVCRAPANHYCVDTRDSVCGHACKYRNLERLSLVEKYYGKREEAGVCVRLLCIGGCSGLCAFVASCNNDINNNSNTNVNLTTSTIIATAAMCNGGSCQLLGCWLVGWCLVGKQQHLSTLATTTRTITRTTP